MNWAQAYLHPRKTLRLLVVMTLSQVSSVISCTMPWFSVPPIPALLTILFSSEAHLAVFKYQKCDTQCLMSKTLTHPIFLLLLPPPEPKPLLLYRL